MGYDTRAISREGRRLCWKGGNDMFNAGFDIGGSHIAGGLYDARCTLVRRVDEPFPQGRPEEVPALVARMAGELCEGLARGALESVGLAVPGSIDRARERVINAYNLGFHDFPLRARVQERFPDAPVLLGNDADLAALAELHAGAFIGAQCAVLLTLGTGLGGGIIINGRLWRGGMGNGCEIGHTILDMSGEICTCGVRGCAETRCAASALARTGAPPLARGPARSSTSAPAATPKRSTPSSSWTARARATRPRFSCSTAIRTR